MDATKDGDRWIPIKWWNMYGVSTTCMHALTVLSQVVNTSYAERCWSTYNAIHGVKRNNPTIDRARILVYVHYNLRLLSHYCEAVKNDRTYTTWDDNPWEVNLEDGIVSFRVLGQ
jgi:hypothetical protein